MLIRIEESLQPAYNPSVKIGLRLFRQISSVIQSDQSIAPRNLQIYFIEGGEEGDDSHASVHTTLGRLFIPDSVSNSERRLLRLLFEDLLSILKQCNPFVLQIKSAIETVQPDDLAHLKFTFSSCAIPVEAMHQQQYGDIGTLQKLPVVSVLFGEPGRFELAVTAKGGDVVRINQNHQSFDSLFYVLLFPQGEPGWCENLRERGCSLRDYYAFYTNTRSGEFNTLFYGGKLFSEYLCCAAAKILNDRLSFIKSPAGQRKIKSSTYAKIKKATETDKQVGLNVVLPATFPGSPRYQKNCFQDCMAVTRTFKRPALFITMTCICFVLLFLISFYFVIVAVHFLLFFFFALIGNKNWKEITDCLLPGQTAADRPEIISRVFRIKLKALLSDIVDKGIFGEVVGIANVTEFQKRGIF